MNVEDSPLVSVVIACYNHENFVQDCIKSVVAQTYDNIELIIIDDGSKDSSVEKISELTNVCQNRFSRFEFRHRSNKGLTATLNEALEWCQGEYYCPFASDDIMLENKTEVQVNYLMHNLDVVAVFGSVYLINNDGIFLKEWPLKSKKYNFNDIFLHKHSLPAPSQMIRMNTIRKIGGYNKDIVIEDWYTYLKLSKMGEIVSKSNFVCEYRIHDTNFSKNLQKLHEGRKQVLSIFSHEQKYNEAFQKIHFMNAMEIAKEDKSFLIFKLIRIFLKYPFLFLWFLLNRFKV